MPIYMTLLTVCYPLLVHLGVYTGQLVMVVYFFSLLLCLPFVVAIAHKGRPNIWQALLLMLGVTLFYSSDNYAVNIVQAQPVIMFSFAFILFGSSLRAGSVPLISRFAILIRGDVSAAVNDYGRGATRVWALFFLVMIFVSLYLAITASIETWSWFANVLSYVLVLLMFVIEFAVRRRVLKDHVDYSFIQFIRELSNVDYRRLMQGWRA